MTKDQLDRLEAAAKAATPGPWIAPHGTNVFSDQEEMSGIPIASCTFQRSRSDALNNSTFIATANPQAILDLIAYARKLEQDQYAGLPGGHRLIDAALAQVAQILNNKPKGDANGQ